MSQVVSYPFRIVFFSRDVPDKIKEAHSDRINDLEIIRPNEANSVLWLKVSAENEMRVYEKAAKFIEPHRDSIHKVIMIAKR